MQFTIKFFKGCRRVKHVIKKVAVYNSNVDIQWINTEVMKKGESKDSFTSYLFQLNILSEENRKINKRPRQLKNVIMLFFPILIFKVFFLFITCEICISQYFSNLHIFEIDSFCFKYLKIHFFLICVFA